MRRTLLMATLMLAGTAATVGAVCVGLSELRRSGPQPATAEARRRVALGPTRLRYFEDENVLTLAAEAASDREGYYYIVYLPAEAKWLKEMPDWCRHRRAEIFAEIKRLTADERIKWVEYGDAAQLPNKVLQADDHLGRFAPSVARR